MNDNDTRRTRKSTSNGRGRHLLSTTSALSVLALLAAGAVVAVSTANAPEVMLAQNDQDLPPDLLQTVEVPSLDGSGNNLANPDRGAAGNAYSRVAPADYADGVGEPHGGPDPRYLSNRVFNDVHQNLFSQRNVTQWALVWGQFVDHTFGLRLGRDPDDPQGETQNIPFDPDDPIEEFENDLGYIPFDRSVHVDGTGVTNPREQVNTVSSYIDGFAVYGGTEARLEWLRDGPVDGDLATNDAHLLLSDGYLPRRDARGDPDSAPDMEIVGMLQARPERAVVAGDIRANENIALTATHTLFAREHNRIVERLPDFLTEQEKFDVARRVVIAQQQYVTFTEFLPALGVHLPPYTGYDPTVNVDLSNEFATVGYRAHSMVHGEFELETNLDRYTAEELAAFEEMGLEVDIDGDEVEIEIPLSLAFANPDLLEMLQLGPMLQGIGLEAQYKNDEQIDNQLRSVLFEIPVPGNPECLDGPDMPECYDGVVDLGAIDVERGRDHGIPRYNELREAYGLAPKDTFTDITGEDTAEFPEDPELTPGEEIDDPASLDFLALFDIDGNEIALDSDEAETDAVVGLRRTTLASRLNAIYGDVDEMDAFTGMLSEEHVPGTEFGELQLAIWAREFTNLRDGDRFFYGNDPALDQIADAYGIDYRRTLGEVIADNTDITPEELNHNVFLVAEEPGTTACHVEYTVESQWADSFLGRVRWTNTGDTPTDGWNLSWRFPTGQRLIEGWNAPFHSDGEVVEVTVPAGNWPGTLPPGASAEVWFRAEWDGATNAPPSHFTRDGRRCTTG